MRRAWELLKRTYEEWRDDKVPRLGAALAFYAIFALAPSLVLIVGIAGLAFGAEAARGQLVVSIGNIIDYRVAEVVQELLARTSSSGDSIIATIVGVVTMLVIATGLFAELQSSLDEIWDVQPKPDRTWRDVLKERFLAFVMVLLAALLLLAAMIGSIAFNAATARIGDLPWLWALGEWLLPVVVFTIVFAALYKFLPDVIVAWRDVLVGAFVTAVMLTVGKYLISLYIAHSSVSSAFGAAGSLAILLLWIYYSCQIIFLGAEFTQVYAREFGRGMQPDDNAMPIAPSAPPPISQRPRPA